MGGSDGGDGGKEFLLVLKLFFVIIKYMNNVTLKIRTHLHDSAAPQGGNFNIYNKISSMSKSFLRLRLLFLSMEIDGHMEIFGL